MSTAIDNQQLAKTVVIRLKDERYARLVIEVEDPPATAAAIQGAISEG